VLGVINAANVGSNIDRYDATVRNREQECDKYGVGCRNREQECDKYGVGCRNKRQTNKTQCCGIKLCCAAGCSEVVPWPHLAIGRPHGGLVCVQGRTATNLYSQH
jgi:hypothetical protein